MVIIDKFLQVSDNQALTGAGVGGNFFSSAVKLSSGIAATFRDIGRGNELALRIHVAEAFSGTATILDTTLVVSDDDDSGFFLTNLINLTKWSNATAVLTLNATFSLPLATIPKHMLDLVSAEPGRRYLGVLYSAIGGTYTTGKVTADFGPWRDASAPSMHGTGYRGP
jgi:hypothetical protein